MAILERSEDFENIEKSYSNYLTIDYVYFLYYWL